MNPTAAATEEVTMNDTDTQLFEVFFTLGTDTWGRRLETRTFQRAESKEQAIEMVVASGIAREAITGAGIA